MLRSPILAAAAGAWLSASLAILTAQANGPRMAARLSSLSVAAIAQAGGEGVRAHFRTTQGWPTRHPLLTGGTGLDPALRDRAARAVAAIAGVGAVHWAGGPGRARPSEEAAHPLHCQQDVDALLRSRTIRFQEGSATIEAASAQLVDEVGAALRPCLGSIIAITGHTDKSGREPDNVALSRARAEAVRDALIERGIPADGMRVKGVGSAQPVQGLAPADAANRRIEFSVIASVPVRPTPVDVPGAQ